MEVGALSMIEAIFLQIPSPVREALQVCSAYHCNCLMYAKHILLHYLVVPFLDLIQSPYHGIIITLVAEWPFHVHQQVPHRDVLAPVQSASPFAWVPTETGEDVGVHTSLIILLEKGIYIEGPECVCHLCPRSVDLKISISNLMGTSHFLSLLPLWPLCLCWWPMVSLAVEYPSESGAPLSGEEGGKPPFPTNCSALGLWWPSMQLRCPSMGGEPCLSPLSHPRGSSILLRCAPHQLARGARLLCCSN